MSVKYYGLHILLKAIDTASRGWVVTYFPLHVSHLSQASDTKLPPVEPSGRQDAAGLLEKAHPLMVRTREWRMVAVPLSREYPTAVTSRRRSRRMVYQTTPP